MDAPISKNPEHKARNIAIFFALMGTVTMIPPVEAVDSILNEDNRNIALVSSNDDKTDDKTALNDLNIDQLIKFCNFYKKSTFSEGDTKFRNTYNEGASDIKLIQTIKNNEQFKNFVKYKDFFKDITEKVRKKIKESLLKSSEFLKNFDRFDKSFKATEEHQEYLANFYYEKFNVVDVNFLNFLKQMFKSRIFLKLKNPTIQTLQEFNDAFASAMQNNFGKQWDEPFEGKPYEFFRKIEQLGKNQSTKNLTLNDFFKCFSNDDNCDFPNPEVNAQWEEKKRSLFIEQEVKKEEKKIAKQLSISIEQVQEEASMAIDFLDKKILETHARKARAKEDKERTVYHQSYSKFFRDLTMFFHSDKHENSEEAEKKLSNEITQMLNAQWKSKNRTTDEISTMLKKLYLICNFSMPEKDLMTTKEEELLLSLAYLQPKTAAAIIVLLDGLKKILNNPSEKYTGNLNNERMIVSQIEKSIEQKKRDKMSEAVESTQKTTVEQLPPPASYYPATIRPLYSASTSGFKTEPSSSRSPFLSAPSSSGEASYATPSSQIVIKKVEQSASEQSNEHKPTEHKPTDLQNQVDSNSRANQQNRTGQDNPINRHNPTDLQNQVDSSSRANQQTQQDDELQDDLTIIMTTKEFLDDVIDKKEVWTAVKASVPQLSKQKEVKILKKELELLLKKFKRFFKQKPFKSKIKSHKAREIVKQTRQQNQWFSNTSILFEYILQNADVSAPNLQIAPLKNVLHLKSSERNAINHTLSALVKDLDQQSKAIIKADRDKKREEARAKRQANQLAHKEESGVKLGKRRLNPVTVG